MVAGASIGAMLVRGAKQDSRVPGWARKSEAPDSGLERHAPSPIACGDGVDGRTTGAEDHMVPTMARGSVSGWMLIAPPSGSSEPSMK